jgi:hypothetical protein
MFGRRLIPPFAPTSADRRATLIHEQQADAAAHARDAEALRSQIQKASDECARHTEALASARQLRIALEGQLTQLSHTYDRRRSLRDTEIMRLADPRIDECLTWLQGEHDKLGKKVEVNQGRGPLDPATGQRPVIYRSNYDAVSTVARAIHAARIAAEALKRQDVADLDAAIEQIKRSIPSLADVEDRLRDAS